MSVRVVIRVLSGPGTGDELIDGNEALRLSAASDAAGLFDCRRAAARHASGAFGATAVRGGGSEIEGGTGTGGRSGSGGAVISGSTTGGARSAGAPKSGCESIADDSPAAAGRLCACVK